MAAGGGGGGTKFTFSSHSSGRGGGLTLPFRLFSYFCFPFLFPDVAVSKEGGTKRVPERADEGSGRGRREAAVLAPLCFPWIDLVSSCFWRGRALGTESEHASVIAILQTRFPDQPRQHQHRQRTLHANSQAPPQQGRILRPHPKKCKCSVPTPDPLNQKLCGWSPEISPCFNKCSRLC